MVENQENYKMPDSLNLSSKQYQIEQTSTQKKQYLDTTTKDFLNDKSFLRDLQEKYDSYLYEDEYDDTYDSLDIYENFDSTDDKLYLTTNRKESDEMDKIENFVSIYKLGHIYLFNISNSF
jgi:hypothetical protein